MAVDMFFKIEYPDVKGESRDENHAEEIDVLSWSWGMTQSGSSFLDEDEGRGKVNVEDISITKYIDSASPNLQKGCATGQHFDKATLTVRRAGGGQQEYLIIELERVLVSSISIDAGGDDKERFTETVSFNFEQWKTTYYPLLDSGERGGAIEFGWNIEFNRSL